MKFEINDSGKMWWREHSLWRTPSQPLCLVANGPLPGSLLTSVLRDPGWGNLLAARKSKILDSCLLKLNCEEPGVENKERRPYSPLLPVKRLHKYNTDLDEPWERRDQTNKCLISVSMLDTRTMLKLWTAKTLEDNINERWKATGM